MSGPVELRDVADTPVEADLVPRPVLALSQSRKSVVASMEVQRALPTKARRTVGSWCFADQFGPMDVAEGRPDIGPHPHIGLQTVTWLLDGEMLHRDSLGSEQIIRPGQLNVMTAGHGVAHAEEVPGTYAGRVHGLQLWIAQPSATREAPGAFEHHAELPQLEFGSSVAVVLGGSFGGAASPARHDSDLVGVDLVVRQSTAIPLDPSFEYAMVVTDGVLSIDRRSVSPGQLLYLGGGRDELLLTGERMARVLLLGGVPFPEPVLMWWNFVARTREEISAAYEQWTTQSGRFGTVASRLPRIETPPPPWYTMR